MASACCLPRGGAQNAAEASTIAEQASSNSDELIEGQTPASYSTPLVSAAPSFHLVTSIFAKATIDIIGLAVLGVELDSLASSSSFTENYD